ncbi:MAG: bifunctional diguanylate cyclase/phosphodiesterase [Pseudomonadota bacterium]
MTQSRSVDVVVVSDLADDAESVSQTLRNGGVAARCTRAARHDDVGECLTRSDVEIVFVFAESCADDHVAAVLAARARAGHSAPVLIVAPSVQESDLADALQIGAQDLVSLNNPARLQAVALRELRSYAQSRAVIQMQAQAEKLERQVASLVNESADAIMLVQEGIVVSVNPAWMSLLGYHEDGDVIGTPALDVFVPNSHTPVKGAMSATLRDQWEGHVLTLLAVGNDSASVPVKAQFERSNFDEDPCVRVTLAFDRERTDDKPRELVENEERHPLTGFYRRQRFLREMEKQLATAPKGGLWMLAYLKPDNIAELREQIGPLSSDDLLLEFARVMQDTMRPNDVYGQFGGDLFMVLMQRGTERDASAWAEHLRDTVAGKVFEVAEKSLSVTCSIGLARYDDDSEDLPSLILKAQKAYLEGVKDGGNRTVLPAESNDEETSAGDTLYVKKIKGALMQNNFRLVFQPVASLGTRSQQMFDVLLRMMDGSREIMPVSFMPPARRNGLLKPIDRWVIGNAMRFCREHRPAGLFIRLSADSLLDDTLPAWIGQQMAATGVAGSSLIFQITEADVEARLLEARNLATTLKASGCKVALEHFGVTQQPLQTLEHVPLDFLKIDGSLMEGITGDEPLQARIAEYIQAAKDKRITTVAERVEDANTMAVLWQLGVEYIQGFYVQGPEEIVLESEDLT